MRIGSLGVPGLSPDLRAVVVASVVAHAFDTAFTSSIGARPPLLYLLLCCSASLALSLGTAAIASWLVSPALARPAWVLVNAGVICAPAAALAAAAVVVALAPNNRLLSSASGGIREGVALSSGFCLAFLVWPEVLSHIPGAPATGSTPFDLLMLLAFGGAVLLLPGHPEQRRRLPSLPHPIPILIALLLVACGLPASWTRFGPRAQVPRFDSSSEGVIQDPLPTVLLLVLDTVRADHLSAYGYGRRTSPSVERLLATERWSVLFPMAFSPGTWTLPAHASLLTGELPSVHGVQAESVYGTGTARHVAIRVERTLPELLQQRGYRTFAVLANGMLFLMNELEHGFHGVNKPLHARPLRGPGEMLRRRVVPELFASSFKPYPSASAVNAALLSFLDGCLPGPCFALANYMEAHSPYLPEAACRDRFAQDRGQFHTGPVSIRQDVRQIGFLKDRYDEEICALDRALGELLEGLEARQVLGRSWVFITSDHGESFGEHGATEHGTSVYSEQTRIPLIVVPPRGVDLPAREEPVTLLDVAATIAAISGVPAFGVGRDLRREQRSPVGAQIEFFGDPRPFRATLHGPLAATPARAVVRDGFKLIEYPSRRELYSLAADPGESRDLSRELVDVADQLAPSLPPLRRQDTGSAGGGRELSDAEARSLRALGYAE